MVVMMTTGVLDNGWRSGAAVVDAVPTESHQQYGYNTGQTH